jgi:hypothetical protein
MLELPEIIAFDWDDGNRLKSRKHGVLLSEAEEVFSTSPFCWWIWGIANVSLVTTL